MTFQAVIFDIDGTLVDTNAAHVEAWREAFVKHGHNIAAERIIPEIGKGGDQLVPSILGKAGEGSEGAAIAHDHGEAFLEIAQRKTFQVFPGVSGLMAGLHRRGLRVALATSSKAHYVAAIERSARMDLRALADVVVTADDAAASKPAPDVVLAALKKLALPAEKCLFVGDTTHDAESAKRAGVVFLGLLCGGCSTEQALRAAGAQSVWLDPENLFAHLDKALAACEPDARTGPALHSRSAPARRS